LPKLDTQNDTKTVNLPPAVHICSLITDKRQFLQDFYAAMVHRNLRRTRLSTWDPCMTHLQKWVGNLAL